jgi:tetratricopeptide (TPR) repeat protein
MKYWLMNLDLAKKLITEKKYAESLKIINNLIKLNEENFELLNLKAFIYFNLQEFRNSTQFYSEALNFKKNDFSVLFFRSISYVQLANYEAAIVDMKLANKVKPNTPEVFYNIGWIYANIGKNNKSIEYFAKALTLNENYTLAKENLITTLSQTESVNYENSLLIKTHKEINKLSFSYNQIDKIDEKNIKNLFLKSNELLIKSLPKIKFSETQIYRRSDYHLGCMRHFKLFNDHKIIPKYCFSCFKVQINLKNVLDLVKLHILFDNIHLDKKNIRKCMIELRPQINGNYKGFIYCNSLDEAKNIQSKLNKLLPINIDKNTSASVKRGCSEFGIEYPKYKNLDKDIMTYNEEWINFEKLIDHKYPNLKFYNKKQLPIKGISLSDILIIRNWLYFAKMIGDESYKKISNYDFSNKFLSDKIKKKIYNQTNLKS